MTILVVGASGLIGGEILKALRQAGYMARGASRNRPHEETPASWLELPFAELEKAQAWLPYLQDVQVVVNCLGIISEQQAGDFDRLHSQIPRALFAACEQSGVQQIIQLSALGASLEASTPYWRSKAEADTALLSRPLRATVIRPSLVYGEGGASTRLFTLLSTLPVLCLPYALQARVQPLHVADLADAVVYLVQCPEQAPRELAAVGPRATNLADYLRDLATGMALPAPRVFNLPAEFAKPLAWLASLRAGSALTPDSLTMLAESAAGGNTADSEAFRQCVSRPLRDPKTFATPAQRGNAVLAWALPALQYGLAFLWLWTAYVSWFVWPQAESEAWLLACGVPASLTREMLMGAVLLDAAIGVRLLWRPPRWHWLAQLLLVSCYTLLLSVCLPEFWHHPFGPLSKNLPLIIVLALCWRLSEERD